ncbi:RloB family protein [Actinomadura rubteroloni]|uniref:RloB family protein n=1 Tax=Actinomadura rubteroloni TaxID=1926885 RepID=UPI000CD8F73D|nr:RloB family protein [Actinomadura rubteroloni]
MARGTRPLYRSSQKKPPKRKIYIYHEGEQSEKGYFRGLCSSVRSPNIKILVSPARGNPLSMVEYAIDSTYRVSGGDIQEQDEIWCVFDIEAPIPQPKIAEAVDLAMRKGVRLVISNPCFEIWLLLHFSEHNAYLTTNSAYRKLRLHLPNYDKHVDYVTFSSNYVIAKDRAKILDRRHQDTGDIVKKNPWSNVWELVDHLMELSIKNDI